MRKYDPRLELSNNDIVARYNALKSMQSSAMKAQTAVERLKACLKNVEDYTKRMKSKDEEALEEQIELSKATKDSINVLLDLFFGKEDERQGITRNQPKTLLSYYGSAARYTRNGLHAPTSTEIKLTKKFESELEIVIGEVNLFFENEWPKFKEAVEAIDLSPFKDYDKIE